MEQSVKSPCLGYLHNDTTRDGAVEVRLECAGQLIEANCAAADRLEVARAQVIADS
jgi:hypothetical protein